jgi:hypothetical protein
LLDHCFVAFPTKFYTSKKVVAKLSKLSTQAFRSSKEGGGGGNKKSCFLLESSVYCYSCHFHCQGAYGWVEVAINVDAQNVSHFVHILNTTMPFISRIETSCLCDNEDTRKMTYVQMQFNFVKWEVHSLKKCITKNIINA